MREDGRPVLPTGPRLRPRQAPPSRPYLTRLRTQPRIAPDDPTVTARQETVAIATSALGPYLEAASDSLLSQCWTAVYTLASSPTFETGSTGMFCKASDKACDDSIRPSRPRTGKFVSASEPEYCRRSRTFSSPNRRLDAWATIVSGSSCVALSERVAE